MVKLIVRNRANMGDAHNNQLLHEPQTDQAVCRHIHLPRFLARLGEAESALACMHINDRIPFIGMLMISRRQIHMDISAVAQPRCLEFAQTFDNRPCLQ
ncbi:hypothetical protein D1872_316590 [compost metagenome]